MYIHTFFYIPIGQPNNNLTITPEYPAKLGISGQKGANDYYDKNPFHLPRQVSCTINRTLVNWGRVGHNVPQTRINTTVSTTKV